MAVYLNWRWVKDMSDLEQPIFNAGENIYLFTANSESTYEAYEWQYEQAIDMMKVTTSV